MRLTRTGGMGPPNSDPNRMPKARNFRSSKLDNFLRVLRIARCRRHGVQLRCIRSHVFAGHADKDKHYEHGCSHKAEYRY